MVDRLTDGVVLGNDTTVTAGSKMLTTPDQLTLDRWGNVLVQRDARDPNWTVTYSYNDAGQIIKTVASGVPGTAITTSSVYDLNGKLIKEIDGKGYSNSYQYDANGALRSETHADYSLGGAAVSIQYTNDAFGQHTAVTQYVSNASGSPGTVTTSYTYDKMGHLLSRTSTSVDVYWVKAGERDEIKLTGVITDSYTYDQLGRRISATNSNSSSPGVGTTAVTSATATTYTRYDLNGNIVAVTNALKQTTLSNYDALNHKISEKVATGEVRSWAVDAYGRITAAMDLGHNFTKYEYNATGQLARQYGVQNLDEKKAGAGMQNISYGYDAFTGQLLTINDAATGLMSSFTYDAAGNRITEKTVLWEQVQSRAIQDNTLRYDAYNRLTGIVSTVPGADYNVQY